MFFNPKEFSEEHPTCSCCGRSFESHLNDLSIDLFTREVSRWLDEPETVRRQTEDDVEFLEEELELALILASGIAFATAVTESIIDAAIKTNNIQRINEAIDDAEAEWRVSAWTNETAEGTERVVERAVGVGVNVANDAVVLPGAARRSIIQGMVNSANYYTNEYFNTQVMPSLHRAVEQALQAGDTAAFNLIRETLSNRLRSVPYWNVVANAAASRAYHYGLLKAGQLAGRRRVQYSAIRDARTSEICKFLDGTTWEIATAVNFVEKIAEVEHPEDIKEIAGWPKYDDIKNMSPSELAEAGVIVPPVHGNCRSSLILF